MMFGMIERHKKEIEELKRQHRGEMETVWKMLVEKGEELAECHCKEMMDRMERSQEPTTWDGESWPPPIGAVLESFATGCRPVEAEVLAVRKGYVIGCATESALPGFLMRDQCRPISTEEESEVEGLKKDIMRNCSDSLFDDEPEMLAEALYDLGYRKIGPD